MCLRTGFRSSLVRVYPWVDIVVCGVEGRRGASGVGREGESRKPGKRGHPLDGRMKSVCVVH